MTKPNVIVAFFLVFLVSASHSAINISGFNTATNDRFANEGSFVADQFDLSGVAYNGTGPSNSGWLTMVSRNVYITAEHAKPTVGSSATFYASNDPNGASLTRSLTSDRQQIGTTDILLGTLDTPLSQDYAFYDFASEAITNNNTGPGNGPGSANSESFINAPYFAANAYVFGRSPTSWPTSQNIAVGRNILDGFQPGRTVTNANEGDSIEADVGGSNAVTYEAQLAVGDSGGPLMVDNGAGGLTIVGLNWFIATETNPPFFGASYVGNYSTQIQEFIDANPVPEPSQTAILLGLVGFASVLMRRRL